MKLNREGETRFSGLPVSRGVVLARVCLFSESRHDNLPAYTVSDKGYVRERARLDQAIEIVSRRLDNLKQRVTERIGSAEAEIFLAQKMIVNDPEAMERMDELLKSGCNAETAVGQTMDYYSSQLMDIDDEYINQRAGDIGEIKRRLLDVLLKTSPSFKCQSGSHCMRGQNRVIITKELTPAMTVDMDTNGISGFVTEKGGALSHAAILARALGIPAISGIPSIYKQVPCGTEVMVDGNTGLLVVNPDRETCQKVFDLDTSTIPQVVNPVGALKVMANIGMAEEAEDAVKVQAEGIGLYRTELEFFAAGKLLDEDQQYKKYKSVLDSMDGRPVYFRLLDVGADKQSAIFDIPEEDNPALGCRGSRYLMRRADIFRSQARALARAAAHGDVRVMYPMVAGVDQFIALRERFDHFTEDLHEGTLLHGPMLEVPSACLSAEKLLEVADFASVGTNDLTQYLFAVDRNNHTLAEEYSYHSDILWDILEKIASAAAELDKPVSVCGELASEPEMIAKLMSAGFGCVSTGARHIANVRLAAAEVGNQIDKQGV